MRIKKAILLIALSFSTVAHAQINVMGTISDNEGQPLPGAVVVQYDATHTTVLANVVADIDGGYSIVAAPTDILEFSFLGYEKKQETVGRRAKINVALLPDNSLKLEESVVIGYGSVQRSDLTGSVSTVRMADIGQVPVTNADAALQGRVAGMEVMSTTGEPGATTSIRIRGTRSISASNEPLIVVDGVIDAVKDMNDINPADIKDITVLKDASSTAIYGSRGANGVILITTRSG